MEARSLQISVSVPLGALEIEKAYLLDVFRRRLSFPDVKKYVERLADLHNATVVLIEDKSSGSSLIQQLRSESLSKVQGLTRIGGK